MSVKCLHDLFENNLVFYRKHEYKIYSEEGDFITLLDEYNNKFRFLKSVGNFYTYYFEKLNKNVL